MLEHLPSSLSQASGAWLHVCQMLPIIVLLLASLFSSLLFAPFFPTQPFSLQKTRYSPLEDKATQLTYDSDTSTYIMKYLKQIILAAFVDDINFECLFELHVVTH